MAQNDRIFISYSHQNKATADEIDKTLSGIGLSLIRDVRDLGYRGDVKKFMERVRDSDYIIMLLSDAYLKSPNCMYEVLELVKDPGYEKRILPVLLEDAKIFNVKDHADLIRHWGEELMELEKIKQSIPVRFQAGVIDDQLKRYTRICNELSDFLAYISNVLHKSYEELKAEGYKALLDIIGFEESELWEELLKISEIESKSKRNRAFEKFEEKYPNFFGLPFQKALLIYEEDSETAIEYINDSITLNPNSSIAYYNRGILLADQEKFQEALDDYNEAIRLNPKDAEFYNNRGVLYRNMKNYELSLKDYENALSLNPEKANTYNNRGLLYLENFKDFEKALYDFNTALKINPQSVEAYFNRGRYYSDTGRQREALLDFNKVIDIDNEYVKAYNERGIIYDLNKEYQKALLDYNKALELNPKNSKVYFNRGITKLNLGDRKDACADWGKAATLGNVGAKKMLKKYCKK